MAHVCQVHVENNVQRLEYEPWPRMRGVNQEVVLMYLPIMHHNVLILLPRQHQTVNDYMHPSRHKS